MLLTRALTVGRFSQLQNGRCFTTVSQRISSSMNRALPKRNLLTKRSFETEAKSGWRSWGATTRPTGLTGNELVISLFNSSFKTENHATLFLMEQSRYNALLLLVELVALFCLKGVVWAWP